MSLENHLTVASQQALLSICADNCHHELVFFRTKLWIPFLGGIGANAQEGQELNLEMD